MSANSILNQQKFWDILKYMTQIEDKVLASRVCEDLALSKWELNSFINFLSDIGHRFEVEAKDEDKLIYAPKDKPKFVVEFSLIDWIQFQAHFPKLSECAGKPYHEEFKNKLQALEDQYSDFDIFSPLITLENIFKQHQPALVGEINNPAKEVLLFLEESVLDKECICVNIDNNTLNIYPQKIVYFDGHLNLVGEDILDKCLVNIVLDKVTRVYEDSQLYKPHYSQYEVEEFVRSLKAMTENQVRLVLKIFSRDKFSLSFDHKYYDNACLFTNPEGDFIWAATLEPAPEVFDWLFDLGAAVEILDPTTLKNEFIKYCEDKLKKIA